MQNPPHEHSLLLAAARILCVDDKPREWHWKRRVKDWRESDGKALKLHSQSKCQSPSSAEHALVTLDARSLLLSLQLRGVKAHALVLHARCPEAEASNR